MTTAALWVKTGQGKKLVRIDALSNDPFTRKEHEDFKVHVTSRGVRDKSRRLREVAARYTHLFSDEEQRQMEAAAAELQAKLERERTEARRLEEERRQRERERAEVRDRQAQKKASSEGQWWKQYSSGAAGAERERAKWTARLRRFEAIVASSAEEGERTNAARLADSARKKLTELEAGRQAPAVRAGGDVPEAARTQGAGRAAGAASAADGGGEADGHGATPAEADAAGEAPPGAPASAADEEE